MGSTIETLSHVKSYVEASQEFKSKANMEPQAFYELAKQNPLAFWEKQALELSWFKKWDQILSWKRPFAKWFEGGKLNAAYNCLDVHLKTRKNKKALIWEGEDQQQKTLTYQELHDQVARLANVLKKDFSLSKGDRVTLYMPLTPELVVATLACARIGAIHSVVFAGFSETSLKERIADSGSKLVITSDGGYRRGKVVALKKTVDKALEDANSPVEHVIVFKRIGDSLATYMKKGRDYDYNTLLAKHEPLCEAEIMESEDELFILYTSGTTGKPKGIVHSTGGYLTYAKYSTKLVFDLKEEDIYWCTADVGWITGHSYLVYGPLSNGASVFMYEGAPDYPSKSIFWSLIEKYRVSIFYTAPTAIRAFMKWGTEHINKHDLSSLRLLGSVGEPINPEAWSWYYKHIGNENCPIVDTWWQTETGGILCSSIPALHQMKPGSTGLPLPGIEVGILDEKGQCVKNGGGLLAILKPWPSMLRGVWKDEARFIETYWKRFEGYFSGDGATIDEKGYIKVLGRVDDVLNVAGHRIGTMELESALVEHSSVAEAAVVGVEDEIKGQAIAAFVILKEHATKGAEIEQKLIDHLAKTIGPIAKPKHLIVVPDLPKTRSGKIIRRLLKAILEGHELGDLTTLANPDVIEHLKVDKSK